MFKLSYSTSPAVPATTHVLVVDDDRAVRMLLSKQLEGMGYSVHEAGDGEAAWDLMESATTPFDVVLMDRLMPRLDGLSLVIRMKADSRYWQIPVVMITGSSQPEIIQESIDGGVFYFLTKPLQPGVLASVVRAAVDDRNRNLILAQELRRHKTTMRLMDHAHLRFRTLQEAEELSGFLANALPDPARMVSGLAEIMVNAVEHGLLRIGYDQKTQLMQNGEWRSEIERLEALPENASRFCEVSLLRRDGRVQICIKDPGPGFAWRDYLMLNPTRATDSHGRGIALARQVCFPTLIYNEVGNEALIVTEEAA